MRYLYTNTPDEGCHEISDGVYGRPCHTAEMPKLKAKGWKERASDVPVEKSAKSVEDMEAEKLMAEAVQEYEVKFGKKPHHKMKLETIIEALSDDQRPAGEQNTDADGDQHAP